MNDTLLNDAFSDLAGDGYGTGFGFEYGEGQGGRPWRRTRLRIRSQHESR